MARHPGDYGAKAEQLLTAAGIYYQRLERNFESRWHATAAARLAEIERCCRRRPEKK